MKLVVSSFLILVICNICARETTPKLETRLKLLKEELAHKFIQKHGVADYLLPIDNIDNLEYVDTENEPITPIMEFDELKKDDKFKLPRLKSTTKKYTIRSINSPGNYTKKFKKIHRINKSKIDALRANVITTKSKPIDIFYRRNVVVNRKKSVEWLHCSDLITPYIHGVQREVTRPRTITAKDHVVSRLIHLLNLNTADYTKEEIYSVMFQISKLEIRFFLWEVSAMKLLFNVITKGKPHTFKELKRGVKNIFESWRLDNSNTTRLLLQTRIFRPPCVYHNHTGSTKSGRGSIMTHPTNTNSDERDCTHPSHF